MVQILYRQGYLNFTLNSELLGTKFEPFTGRFPAFVRHDRGLKRKAFDF